LDEAPVGHVRGASQELGVDKIYVEEVKLVGCGSNAVHEEQNIPLQPGNFLRWILEAAPGPAILACTLEIRIRFS
jgi:hypothetical protein